ncbi:MAG: DUF928 domain-containing protein [Leptolyngbyaceae cyanobacterium]
MRSQNLLASVSFTLAILANQLGSIAISSAIPNSINSRTKQELPPVPSTPRPPAGNRTPGGGLGEQAVCPVTQHELTAITPTDTHGTTVSEYPTFWFYMPYTADEVQNGEFSILTQDEETRIYKTSFEPPAQAGFVSITLPADIETSLQEGQYYHWYLTLSCLSSTEAVTNLNIDGWIQRVSSAPDRTLSPEMWYDMVDYVAAQLQTAPANESELRQLWADLLQSVGLDQFTQEPVIGPVVLTDG